jgi:hypothetical protein
MRSQQCTCNNKHYPGSHSEASMVEMGGAVTVTVEVTGGGGSPSAATRIAREEKIARLANMVDYERV